MEALGGFKAFENLSKTDNVGGPLEAPFWIILVFFVGLLLLARPCVLLFVLLLVLLVVLLAPVQGLCFLL